MSSAGRPPPSAMFRQGLAEHDAAELAREVGAAESVGLSGGTIPLTDL